MPSKKNRPNQPARKNRKSRLSTAQRSAVSDSARALESHALFFPIVILCLVLWYLYRSLFAFPVWFDETLGKALFFGLPVWLYIAISRSKSIQDSFGLYKMESGLLMGIAVGGLFGFVTAIMSLLQRGGVVEAVPLFAQTRFWYEFALAIFTGFWETMFFYSFMMTVILEKYRKWPLVWQLILVVVLFLVFHAPNAVLRFAPAAAVAQMFLLGLFALGQALLFYGRRNAYALVLSHAIWGMVLLVYGW